MKDLFTFNKYFFDNLKNLFLTIFPVIMKLLINAIYLEYSFCVSDKNFYTNVKLTLNFFTLFELIINNVPNSMGTNGTWSDWRTPKKESYKHGI